MLTSTEPPENDEPRTNSKAVVLVSEPVNPSQTPDFSELDRQEDIHEATRAEADQAPVQLVIAWYAREIHRSRGEAGTPPAELMEALQSAIDDREALREAGPEEAARIAARYTTLYKELTSDV
ncbi:hypothetical protein ACFW2T_14300 [Streptomyces sp. NPDC058892]|uniref:hypothetical protein n=1 Tax=unclassified Streptomyces TaxID=2593676 RepID=UPI0036A52D6C